MKAFLLDCRDILRCRHRGSRIFLRHNRGEIPYEIAEQLIGDIERELAVVRQKHWSRALVLDLLNETELLAPGVKLFMVIAAVVTIFRWMT